MPDLNFRVEGAEVLTFRAAPMLSCKLHVANTPADELIHTVVLRCQIRIEAARRHYNGQEPELLLDLFGERERWSQTLKSMLWAFANTVVPPFSGSTLASVDAPCTFDF